MENPTTGDFYSDISNQFSDLDDESELQSMTGKGIKHLCSELIELKTAADEDFQRNIISNSSSFIRIFEEARTIESELMKLKSHVSTQKSLVTNILNGIHFNILSEEVEDSYVDKSECDEISPSNELEAYINNVSETLDIFIYENRIDEALEAIEMEDETFQRLQLEEYYPSELLLPFKSVISEAKVRLTMKIGLMADNPRIAALEIQKLLLSLCRLGDCHLATKLLFKYYNTRIASRINNLQLQCSTYRFSEEYIRHSGRYIFSMIAQAAKSFCMLHGENSPSSSELFQWACEEIQVFIGYLGEYVKSVSEISGQFSMAVKAIFLVKTFCSLLEAQQLCFQSYLIKLISPYMEEVLVLQVDRIRKVLNMFTASENWVLGRYLLSEVINVRSSAVIAGQEPEFCLLTTSGRQFLSMLQAFIKDVYPLVELHMEDLILCQLKKLFDEYRAILKKVVTRETVVGDIGDLNINRKEALQQQVSILANLSTIERVFFLLTKSIFGKWHANSELLDGDIVGRHIKELDSYLNHGQEECDELRAHFCQQFIYKTVSFKGSLKFIPESRADYQSNPNLIDIMPSISFQVLFLELRKLEKLAEGQVFEVDWLMELLRELIENIFVWLPENKDRWEASVENVTLHQSNTVKQIILDVQFLVEIVKCGGYFSDYPLNLTTLTKSLLMSMGVDRKTENMHGEWVRRAACEAVEKLIEFEKTLSLSKEEECRVLEEDKEKSISSDDYLETRMDILAIDMTSDESENKDEDARNREMKVNLNPSSLSLVFPVMSRTQTSMNDSGMGGLDDIKRT